MSDYNPYRIHDDDDDESSVSSSKQNTTQDQSLHDITGQPCSLCDGEIHDVVIAGAIPPEVLVEISKFIDNLPLDQRKTKYIFAESSSSAFNMMDTFTKVFATLDNVDPSRSIVRALYHELNKLMARNGESLDDTINFYFIETRMITIQYIIDFGLSFMSSIEEHNKTNKVVQEDGKIDPLYKMTNDILTKYSEELANLKQEYMDLGLKYELPVDAQLLESGHPSEPDAKDLIKKMMGNF